MNRLSRLVFLPAILLSVWACGDDDYHYPSVKQEFLTVTTGSDGRLNSALTDEGHLYRIVEDASDAVTTADSTLRIVANYEVLPESGGMKLYATGSTISPIPIPIADFKDGMKTAPAQVLSIWMGLDYLNMILEVKQQGKHLLHFAEQETESDGSGHQQVKLLLYHQVDGTDTYTKRAYVSVPLKQYAQAGIRQVTVTFSLCTSADEMKSYTFEYIP